MDIIPQLGDRALFPSLKARAYLNHAAVSPVSVAVERAARQVLDDYAQRGMSAVPDWVAQRDRLRKLLGGLIGADEGDIGLVPNTTQGVIDVALCHPWVDGDRVLLFEGEFPANITPWQRASELFGFEICWASVDPFYREREAGLEALDIALEGGVSFVAVSAVQFQTGLRMPLREMGALCQKHGATLFVDGIQACGVAPIDVGWGIDYLSCGGHKWLMGMEGAGFLYIAPGRVSGLRKHVAGWLSHEEGLRFLFEGKGHLRYDRPVRDQANFVEPGAQNVLGYAALEASVGLISALGVPAIHEHVNAYLDRLEGPLVERGFKSFRAADTEGRGGTLSLLPPSQVDGAALQRDLVAAGIACTFPDGNIRFAPHWPNAFDEVPEVIAAVDRSLAAR